jgi:hypothetical protein
MRHLDRYSWAVLHLLVDPSTWLDLAKRRDGQRWIVALRVLAHQSEVRIIVPPLVIDEFERNRERVEASMTASVSQRFRLIKQDIDNYGGTAYEQAAKLIDGLAHQVPLIGALTTRNFADILEILRAGERVDPTDDERHRVVKRGLEKTAPFHRSRNSVADALLIEMYASAVSAADLTKNPHGFVTSNSDDFSAAQSDRREPHPDLAPLFAIQGSAYALGVDGLNAMLLDHFGEEIEQLFEGSSFDEEPRRLDEIMDARASSLIGSGITARSFMSTSFGSRRQPTRSSDCLASRALGAAGSRTGSPIPDRSARTRTSSWECSTASCQHSAGCSAVNGTFWTPEPTH